MFMMLFLSLSMASWGSTKDLEVVVKEMKNANGHLLYLLFENKDGFPDKSQKSLKQGKVTAEEANKGFILKDLPPGNYALSVIHDENDNDKLDTNFLGIPKEGVGFSNNPKFRFGAPNFKECAFNFGEENTKISIKLVHF